MGMLASALVLGSCNDLDQTPSTELPEDEAVTTTADLQNAVNGVPYTLIDAFDGERFTYTSEFTLFGDIRTNDFKIGYNFGQTSSISKYTLTKNDNAPEAVFQYYYAAIGNINKTLEESAALSTSDATVKNLKGQLYAWRGLLHFDLARTFAHIPSTVKDVNAANSGIPLSTQVYASDYKPTRATLKATYDTIVTDLTKAAEMMADDKDNVNPSNYVGKMNYYAAIALRARAYLYMGEYAKALADAQEVINSRKFELYTTSNYASVWATEGTSESIFEIQTTSTHNSDRYSTGYFNDADGYAECAFNEKSKLFQYLMNNDTIVSGKDSTILSDVRRNAIKDQTSGYDVPGYYSNKYPGRGSVYVNNPKIVRLSEMYLIAAEAEYYLNGGAAAAPYINDIERNRIVPVKGSYTEAKSVTLDDILFEYEKEFFTENQIAFAYWRNKRSVTSNTGKEITYDSNLNIFPIPQREIDLNGALTQNAGY